MTGRHHATTVTGQGDFLVRAAVGMSDCVALRGVVTGQGRIEDGLERSGCVLVGAP